MEALLNRLPARAKPRFLPLRCRMGRKILSQRWASDPANIITIKNADGNKSYGTSVNVKPFRRTWQSFETKEAAA
jgi:hypothetical protein